LKIVLLWKVTLLYPVQRCHKHKLWRQLIYVCGIHIQGYRGRK